MLASTKVFYESCHFISSSIKIVESGLSLGIPGPCLDSPHPFWLLLCPHLHFALPASSIDHDLLGMLRGCNVRQCKFYCVVTSSPAVMCTSLCCAEAALACQLWTPDIACQLNWHRQDCVHSAWKGFGPDCSFQVAPSRSLPEC